MYQLKRALVVHIEENIIKYILFLSLFFAGILIGIILSGNLSAEMTDLLKEEITVLIDGLASGKADSTQILLTAFLKNARLFILVFICGFFIWLIPLTLFSMFLEGVSSGFAAGYLCAAFGGTGMWIAIVSLLPTLLFGIPLYIFMSVVSMNNSLNRSNRGSVKKYVVLFLIVYIISHISVVVDGVLIPSVIMLGCG